MKLKAQDIEIIAEEPFRNDALGLKVYADTLTNIVGASEDGLTLSINAGWGYGKTTFVKMWNLSLQNEGYTTVYLNAWETDFAKDPLLALMNSLQSGIDIGNLDAEKKQLWGAVTDAIIGITKSIPGLGIVGAIGETAKKSIDDCLADTSDLQKFQSYMCLLDDFRQKFSAAVTKITPDKPLILFVDELDRCRPNYSVEMLERIKHFFAVDNVVFVLSIDKTVMLQAIRGVYNSADLDAGSYLRRFIDLEFNLPEPKTNDFIRHLYEKYGLSAYENGYWEFNDKHFARNDKDNDYIVTITRLFQSTDFSLRDIEKYFTRLSVIMKTMAKSSFPIEVASLILFVYIFDYQVYSILKSKGYKYEDLMLALEHILYRKTLSIDDAGYFMFMIYSTAAHYARYVGGTFEQEVTKSFDIDKFKFARLPFHSNNRNIYQAAQREIFGSYLESLFPVIELLRVNF